MHTHLAARPLVSVVTPSLNQGRFVGRTLASVRAQDYEGPIEHLVADGGSTDETLSVLREYPTVDWRSEPDEGQSDAINKALGRARGDIFGWLNSSDVYAPCAVRTAVEWLTVRPDLDLVYGDLLIIDQDDRRVRHYRAPTFDYWRLLTLDFFIPQPSVFFRRRVIEQTGWLDPGLHLAMDFDYWLRAGLNHRIAHIPRILSAFRLHDLAKSGMYDTRGLDEILLALNRIFDRPELAGRLKALRPLALSMARMHCGYHAFLEGEYGAAQELLSAGLRDWPNPLTRRALGARLLLLECLTGIPVASAARRIRDWASRLKVSGDRKSWE